MNRSTLLAGLFLVFYTATSAPEAVAVTYSGSFDETVPEANALGISSSLVLVDDVVISSLSVAVTIDHPWIGDLTMTLTAPDGTRIVLLDRPGLAPGAGLGACCGSGADLNSITFDDAATLAAEDIVSSFDLNPVAAPTDLLASLNGLAVTGVWTLTIADFAQGQMNTVAPSWSLIVNESIQPVPLPGALGLFVVALGGIVSCRAKS
ncbi:MAG: proprotein convertase P-domain-containing protein [Pseudomonadota bacterium]